MSDYSVQQQEKMLNNSKNDNSFPSTQEYNQLVSEVNNLRKLYQNLEKQISQGGKTGNIELNENTSQFEHLTRSYKCLKYEVKNLKSADVINRLSSLETNVSQQAILWNDFSNYFQDFVTKLGKNDSNSNQICSQMKKPLLDINKKSENQQKILSESDQEFQSKKNRSNENQDNSILNELQNLKQQVQSLKNKDIPDRLSAVEDKLSTHNSLWDQFTSNIGKLYSSQKTSGSEKYKKELKDAHEQFSQLIQIIIQEENESLSSNSTLEQRLEALERSNKIQTSLWNQFSSNISDIISLDNSSSTANNTKKQDKLREAGSQFKQLISQIAGNEPTSESSNKAIRCLKHEMKHILQRISTLEDSNADISSLEEQVRQHSILWARFQENIHHLLNNNGNNNDPNPQFADDIRSLIQKNNGKVTTREIQLESSGSFNNGNENDRLSRLENNVKVQQELWNLFLKNISAATTNNETSNSDQSLKNRDAFISMVGELVRKNSNNNNTSSDQDQSYRISQLESQVRAQSHLWEQFVNNLQNSIGLNSSNRKAQSTLTKQYNEYHSQLEKLVNISDGNNVNTRSVDVNNNTNSEKALDELREQIKKLEEKHERENNSLKSTIKDIGQKQTEAEKATNEMIQTIQDQQQKQIQNLQKDLTTAQKDLTAAQKDIKTSLQNQKTQKGDLENIKSELQKYKKQNQSQDQAHHKFEEEIQKLQSSQKQQQTNMDKHQQDYQKLQKDLQKVQKTQQTQEKSVKNCQSDLQKLQTAQQEQDNKLKNYQEEQQQLREDEHKQLEEARQKLDEVLQKLQAQDNSFKTIQNDLQKVQKAQQTHEKSAKNYKNDIQKLQTTQQEQDNKLKNYQEEQNQLREDEHKQLEEANQKLEEVLQKQQAQDNSFKTIQNDLQKVQKAQQTHEKSAKNYKTDIQKLQTAQQEQDKLMKEYQEEQRKLHEEERQKLDDSLQTLDKAQKAQDKTVKTIQSDLQKVQKAQQTQDKSVKNYKSDIQKLQNTQQEQDKAIKNYQDELTKLQTAQQEQDNKLKNYQEEQQQLREDEHKQLEEARQKLDEVLQKLQAQENSFKTIQNDLQKVQKAQQSHEKSAKNYKADIQKLQTAQQEQDNRLKNYQEEQRQIHDDERKEQEEARLKIKEDIQNIKAAQDKSAKDYQTELQKLQKTQQTQDRSVKNSQAELQKLQKAQQVPDGLFKTYQEEHRKLHEDELKQQEEEHQKLKDELKKLQTTQQNLDKSLKTYQNELQKVQKTQQTQDESLQNYQEEQRKLYDDEHRKQEEEHQKLGAALQKLENAQQNQDKSVKNFQNDLQKVQKAQQSQDKSVKNYKTDIQKLQTAQQEQDKFVKNCQSDLQKLQRAQQEQDQAIKNYQEEQNQLREDEHKQLEEANQKLEEVLQKQQAQDNSFKTIQNDLQKVQKAQQTHEKSAKNYKTDIQKLQTAQQEQDKLMKEYQEEQRKQQEEEHQKLHAAVQKLEDAQQNNEKAVKNIQGDLQKVQKAQQTQDRSVKNSQAELQKIQQAQQAQQVPDGLFKTYQEEQRKLHDEEQKQQEEEHQKIKDELKKLQTTQQNLDKSLKTYQNELQKVQKTQKKQDETVKNSQTALQKLKEEQQEQRQIHEDEHKQQEEENQKFDDAIQKLESAHQAHEETFKNHQAEFQNYQRSNEESPKSSQEDLHRIEEELQKHSNILQEHDDIFTRYQEEQQQLHENEHRQQEEEHQKLNDELKKIQNDQKEQNEKVQNVENDVNTHSKLWEQFTRNLNGLLNINPNENDTLNGAVNEYNEQLKELATRNVEVQELGSEENLRSLEKLRKDVDTHSLLWNQFVQNLLKLNIVDPNETSESEEFLKQSQKEFAEKIQSLTSSANPDNENVDMAQMRNQLSEVSHKVAQHDQLWINYERNLKKLLSKAQSNSNDEEPSSFENDIKSLLVQTRSVELNPSEEGNNQSYDSRLDKLESDVQAQKSLWEQFSKNIQILTNCDSEDDNSMKALQQSRDSFANQINKIISHNNNNNSNNTPDLQEHEQRIEELEKKAELQSSLWTRYMNNIQGVIAANESNSPESKELLKDCQKEFVDQMKSLVDHKITSKDEPLFGSYERLAKEVSEIRKELNSLKSGNHLDIKERDANLDESSLSENYAKNPARYDMSNIRSAYDLPYSESHANNESSSSFEEAEYCQESSEYSSACPTSRSINNDNDENENNEENNNENNQQHQHHHHHQSKKSSSPENRDNNYQNEPTVTTRDINLKQKDGSHTTNVIHKVNNGPIQEQVDIIYKELKCIKYELKQLKFRADGNSTLRTQQNPINNRFIDGHNLSPEFLTTNNNDNNADNFFNIDEPEESNESESEGGDYTNDELNKKIKTNKKSISRLQKKFDMIHSSMNKQVSLWNQFDDSLHQLLNATLAEMEMPTATDISNLRNSIRCVKYEVRKMKIEENAKTEKLFEKKKVQEKQLQEEISQLVEEVRKLQKVCAKFNNIEEDSFNKNITDSIKCLKHEIRNLKKNSNLSSEQKSTSTTEQSSILKRRGILSDENKKSSDNNSASKFASQASLDEWINEVKNLRNLYETIQYNSEIRPLSSAADTQSNTLLMSEEAASSSSFIDEKSEFSEISQHKKNTDSRISKISDIPTQGHEVSYFNTNQPNDQIREQMINMNNQIAALRSDLEGLKHEFKKMQYESISNPQNGKNTATTLLSTSSSSSQEHLEKLNNSEQSFESRIDLIEKALAKMKHNMKNNTRSPSDNNNTTQDETQSSLAYDVRCIKYELKKIKETMSKPSSLSPAAINSILSSKSSSPTQQKGESEEGTRIIQYIFSQLEELPKLRKEIEELKKQENVNEREIIIDQNDESKSSTVKQLINDIERLKAQLSSLNGRVDFISKGQSQKDDTLINGSISNISSLSLEDSFGDILTSDQSQTRFEDINHEIENIHKELKNLTSQLSTIQDIVATTIRAPDENGSADNSGIELTPAQQQLLQHKQQRIDDILNDLNNVKEEIKAIKANQFMFSDNSSVTSINSTSSIPSLNGTSKNDTISILAKKYKKLQEQQYKLKEQFDQFASSSPSKLVDSTKASSNIDPNAEILELKETMNELKLDQKRLKKLVLKYVQQGDKQQITTNSENKDNDLIKTDDASQLDTLKHDINQTRKAVNILKREVTQLSSNSKNNTDDISYLKGQYDMIRGELSGFASIAKLAASPKTTTTPASSKK